ncbi:hypothetical protein Ac2012v2_003988 [Leucoagaricus gongylophorus]
MSWLKEMVGGEVMPPFELDDPKVEDPAIPNRMVSTKSANRPFLTHKAYRRRQEALHAEWLKMKKERDDKIARGEEVGPLESDPTAVQEVGLLGLLKFVLYTVLVFSLAGKFITGSFVWGHESKWLQLKTYLPKNERLFSERMLAQFDGSDSTKPIYLAIDGDVYDVTQGKAYHPGGSYHILAGVDAARAFATGCFKDHRTHDLRGLSDAELKVGPVNLSPQSHATCVSHTLRVLNIGRTSTKTTRITSRLAVYCTGQSIRLAQYLKIVT